MITREGVLVEFSRHTDSTSTSTERREGDTYRGDHVTAQTDNDNGEPCSECMHSPGVMYCVLTGKPSDPKEIHKKCKSQGLVVLSPIHSQCFLQRGCTKPDRSQFGVGETLEYIRRVAAQLYDSSVATSPCNSQMRSNTFEHT